MSKELRALAIVFGILAGLVVLGFAGIAIAFAVFARHVASEPRDPAAMARAVHKIATFTMPPGYVVENATDMGFSVSATLRPGDRYSAFRITLQGSPVAISGDSQTAGTTLGLTLAERLLGCSPAVTTSSQVRVRGAARTLHELRCTDKSGRVTRADTVDFAGNAGWVTLTAVGTGGSFDEPAVREILASVK
jgi:hypothetical protein